MFIFHFGSFLSLLAINIKVNKLTGDKINAHVIALNEKKENHLRMKDLVIFVFSLW